MEKETSLTLRSCTDYVSLDTKEIQKLLELISQNPNKHITIGQFGCAIGSGVLVYIDGDVYNITDYEAW
jgi:hypothetical protein